MRTYSQYCSMAKALDVVGDRWTMLIVRELLLRGPSRYTDLRDGLPGIATNLLGDRLRELEQAGVVSREEAPAPIARTLFALTPRGEQLRSVMDALAQWGMPYMVRGPEPGDEFRERWLTWPAELFLSDHDPLAEPLEIELRTGPEPMVVAVGGGEVSVEARSASTPAVVLSGPPHAILGLLSGGMGLARAQAAGLALEGDAAALARVLPQGPPI